MTEDIFAGCSILLIVWPYISKLLRLGTTLTGISRKSSNKPESELRNRFCISRTAKERGADRRCLDKQQIEMDALHAWPTLWVVRICRFSINEWCMSYMSRQTMAGMRSVPESFRLRLTLRTGLRIQLHLGCKGKLGQEYGGIEWGSW